MKRNTSLCLSPISEDIYWAVPYGHKHWIKGTAHLWHHVLSPLSFGNMQVPNPTWWIRKERNKRGGWQRGIWSSQVSNLSVLPLSSRFTNDFLLIGSLMFSAWALKSPKPAQFWFKVSKNRHNTRKITSSQQKFAYWCFWILWFIFYVYKI